MKRVILAAAVLASCSGRAEVIPEPAVGPATPEGINTTVLAAVEAPTTTEVAPTTTEAPATTVPTRPTTTARYLHPVTTAAWEGETPLPYEGWAIPKYIVSCETGGTFSWMAYNPSGASGPYQLMPLHFGGELAMNQSRAAQHAKAAQLWDGGKGKSHWQACL